MACNFCFYGYAHSHPCAKKKGNTHVQPFGATRQQRHKTNWSTLLFICAAQFMTDQKVQDNCHYKVARVTTNTNIIFVVEK